MSNNDLEKYYEVLEVDYDASNEEITRAYNHLKNLYTSGSMATEPIDNEWDETDKRDILQKVEEAYEKLLALAPEDRKIEKVPVEEEIVEEEILEEDIVEEEIIEEEIVEEEIPVEEEPLEEEPLEEEPGSVEAEPAEQPPVVEEYRHHEVPEVHIEFDDDMGAGAGADSHHEEGNQLSGILAEVEEEDEAEEEEHILEPEVEELIPEDVEEPEEAEEEEEDTLAEEFIEPGPVSGNTFREIRETRGLSFQELSESTQIPAEILEFIEREEFDRLPDAGYLRWNVTTYAKTLSLDPKECADEYMKRYREWKKSAK